MDDEDYLLALKLQEEFNRETNLNDYEMETSNVDSLLNRKRLRNDYDDGDNDDDDDLNTTQNLVHPQWETLDPTPDAKALFSAFDNKFFQGRLKCVELEWSKRMYACAGICYTRKTRLGMAITIRLSEPLLKLRSRKDLIETLLHEMIHAYLGVLRIREGNGGHGANFKKIMSGINKVAGTNITVYHSFHDEVNIYKTHWWRCNGICQNRSPFFGYVKRTSNRKPGPNDIWWRQHLESCGGSFLKIKEPEKKRKLKNEKNKENNSTIKQNIKKYFPVLDNKNSDKNNFSRPASKGGSSGRGNLSNVVGLKDLTEDSSGKVKSKILSSPAKPMFGIGYSLITPTTTSTLTTVNNKAEEKRGKTTAQELRDIWAKKYPVPSSSSSITNSNEAKETEIINFNTSPISPSSSRAINSNDEESSTEPKKRRVSTSVSVETIAKNDDGWTMVDDEIMIKENDDAVINIISSSDEEDDDNKTDDKVTAAVSIKIENAIKKSSIDRQREIKQEILEETTNFDDDNDLTEDDIELIDDEYNDDDVLNNGVVDDLIIDTSLVDDLFGEDTLLRDFRNENAIVATGTRYHRNSSKDIITCPICEERVVRENLSDHLDGCIGITVKVIPIPGPSSSKLTKKITFKKDTPTVSKSNNTTPTATDLDISDISQTIQPNEEESEGIFRRRGLVASTHACPVCAQEVDVDRINEHLDICLKS